MNRRETKVVKLYKVAGIVIVLLVVIFLLYVNYYNILSNVLTSKPSMNNAESLPDYHNISYYIDENGEVFVKTSLYSVVIGGKN